jgi:hypothetical protein
MTDETTVELTRYTLKLRLGHKRRRRLLLMAERQNQSELRDKLPIVGRYLIKRLNRRYPALAVTMPRWDMFEDVATLRYNAVCAFNYADVSEARPGWTGIMVVPDEVQDVSMPVAPANRAQRRAQ